jgi:hypothetical protein
MAGVVSASSAAGCTAMTIDTQASIRRGLSLCSLASRAPREPALGSHWRHAGSGPDHRRGTACRPRSAHRRGRWPVPRGRRSGTTPIPGCRRRSAPPASVASGRVGRRTLSTCKRTQAARMASFTWTTGTASPRRLGPFPQPVEADVGPVGHGGGDQACSREGTTYPWGRRTPARPHRAARRPPPRPTGRAVAAKRGLAHLGGQGGPQRIAVGKSSRAELATFQVCLSSRAQPAGATYSQKEKEGSPRRIDCPLLH